MCVYYYCYYLCEREFKSYLSRNSGIISDFLNSQPDTLSSHFLEDMKKISFVVNVQTIRYFIDRIKLLEQTESDFIIKKNAHRIIVAMQDVSKVFNFHGTFYKTLGVFRNGYHHYFLDRDHSNPSYMSHKYKQLYDQIIGMSPGVRKFLQDHLRYDEAVKSTFLTALGGYASTNNRREIIVSAYWWKD